MAALTAKLGIEAAIFMIIFVVMIIVNKMIIDKILLLQLLGAGTIPVQNITSVPLPTRTVPVPNVTSVPLPTRTVPVLYIYR